MTDLGLWYQEAVINGVAMPRRRRGNDTSERRWEIFIEPFMIPGEGRRFIELGSNAGFYLRKARELGYEAIGVEKDPLFLAQARYWEAQDPVGVQTVEADLNNYDIPVAHTVLLANILYWQTPEQVAALVKQLRQKALFVIVLGRHQPLKSHRSDCRAEYLSQQFHDWEVATVSIPPDKHFSVKFRNPSMHEVGIDDVEVFDYGVTHKRDYFVKAFWHFLRKLDTGQPIKDSTTKYYKYLCMCQIKRRKRTELFQRYASMFEDIRHRGLQKPLYVEKAEDRFILLDGDHRYLIAKYLGHPRILVTTEYVRHIPSRNKKRAMEEKKMAKTRMRKRKLVRKRKLKKVRRKLRKMKKILKRKPWI